MESRELFKTMFNDEYPTIDSMLEFIKNETNNLLELKVEYDVGLIKTLWMENSETLINLDKCLSKEYWKENKINSDYFEEPRRYRIVFRVLSKKPMFKDEYKFFGTLGLWSKDVAQDFNPVLKWNSKVDHEGNEIQFFAEGSISYGS